VFCRSTRPGCEGGGLGGWGLTPLFAPWAVLLHETGAGAGGRTVGAPAPGAKGGGLGGGGLTPLSHRGRCSYINQSRRRRPDGRSTRLGCEGGGGLGGCGLTPLSHRGRCSYMKPRLTQDSGG